MKSIQSLFIMGFCLMAFVPTVLSAQTETIPSSPLPLNKLTKNELTNSELTIIAAQYETQIDSILVKKAIYKAVSTPTIYDVFTDTIAVLCDDGFPMSNNLVKYTSLTEQLERIPITGRWEVVYTHMISHGCTSLSESCPKRGCEQKNCLALCVWKKLPPQYETLSRQIVTPSEECQVEGPLKGQTLTTETLSEFIMTQAASKKLSTRKVNAQKGPDKSFACLQGQGDPEDCEYSYFKIKTKEKEKKAANIKTACLQGLGDPKDCKVVHYEKPPIKYKTVTKRVLAKEASESTPAIYKTITETIEVQNTGCGRYDPSAKFKIVPKKNQNNYAWHIKNTTQSTRYGCTSQHYNPANDFELYEQIIPAKYRTTPKEVATKSYCAPPVPGMPVMYEIRTQQKLVSPAKHELVTTPAEYKIVQKQVLVKPVEVIRD